MSNGRRDVAWSVFIPMALVIAALLMQTVFQRSQLSAERDTLETEQLKLDQPYEDAQKLRAQLESLAGATAMLADQGNQNAARLRDYLQQQGITIRPPKPGR